MAKVKPEQLKRYIIRKYLFARSAKEAIAKEKHVKTDDCWVDENWLNNANRDLSPAIGFNVTNLEEYE